MSFTNIIKSFSFVLISVLTGSISYSQYSAEKPNVVHRDIDQALLKVTQLEPKIFDYSIKKKSTAKRDLISQPYGFVPENMMKVFPDLVSQTTVEDRVGKNLYRKRSVLTINDVGLIPVLVASIHELQAELERLKVEIAALKAQ